MPNAARRFLFLLASTRRAGNSELLARRAAESLPAEVRPRWLHLLDYPLPDFVDLRHDGAYLPPSEPAQTLLDATLAATDLVLAAPLYWYALPAPAKLYLDHWSGWMRTPGVNFRAAMQGKILWAIIASSGERAEVQPLETMLQLTARYMGMHWGGLLFGNGSRPGDVLQDHTALSAAASFFAAGPLAQ